MKKKILIALFALLVVIAAFASCGGGGGETECTHEYELTSTTKEATCTEAGEATYTCKLCSETKTEALDPLDHDFGEPVVVEPTCVLGGYSEYTCKRDGCGHSEKKHVTNPDPTKHQYALAGTPATCETGGWEAYKCTVADCGQEKAGTYKKLDPLGHTFERADKVGETIIEPTCDEYGKIIRICADCQTNASVEYSEDVLDTPDEMKPLGHSFSTYDPDVDIVAPTCTEAGYIIYHCINNGCNETENSTIDIDGNEQPAALGHDYYTAEDGVEGTHYLVKLAPTCLALGEKAYLCQRVGCGYEASKDVEADADHYVSIPMIPHFTNDNYTTVKEYDADCLNDSYKVVKCACGEGCVEEKNVPTGTPKLDHNWVVNGEQTCKTEGKTPYKCDRVCNGVACGETKLDDPTDADIRHHKADGATPTVAATCISRAKYTCKDCGELYESYADDPTYPASDAPHGNHNYTISIHVEAPTCSAEGYTTYRCSADSECTATQPGAYTARKDHNFAEVTVEGDLVCITCAKCYKDVSAEISTGDGTFKPCEGCANGTDDNPETLCTCNTGDLGFEWEGVVSPADPEKITANVDFIKDKVVWTKTVSKEMPLEIGKGIIVVSSEYEADVTITIYKNGEAINVSATDTQSALVVNKVGTVVYFDLYNYESVDKVVINSTADAAVSFYQIVE